MKPTNKSDVTDDQAFAALTALADYTCKHCRKPVRADAGYRCCGQIYCPLCGDAWCQRHWVASQSRDNVSFPLLERRLRESIIWDWEAWRQWTDLLRLTPPARPLPEQKGVAYLVWSVEQRQSAYSPPAEQALCPLFGPDLRFTSSKNRDAVLLTAAVRPDVQTRVRGRLRADANYFCTDGDAALARIKQFLIDLADGTARLRAQTPYAVVRAEERSQKWQRKARRSAA